MMLVTSTPKRMSKHTQQYQSSPRRAPTNCFSIPTPPYGKTTTTNKLPIKATFRVKPKGITPTKLDHIRHHHPLQRKTQRTTHQHQVPQHITKFLLKPTSAKSMSLVEHLFHHVHHFTRLTRQTKRTQAQLLEHIIRTCIRPENLIHILLLIHTHTSFTAHATTTNTLRQTSNISRHRRPMIFLTTLRSARPLILMVKRPLTTTVSHLNRTLPQHVQLFNHHPHTFVTPCIHLKRRIQHPTKSPNVPLRHPGTKISYLLN